MSNSIQTILRVAATLGLAACGGTIDGDGGDLPPGSTAACDAPGGSGRCYASFKVGPDGVPVELTTPRLAGTAGTESMRIKPFAVLRHELETLVGVVPDGYDAQASAFGAPDRWFREPSISGTTIGALHELHVAACEATLPEGAPYDAAPTTATAEPACRTWLETFARRPPTEAQVAACAGYAVDQTAAASSVPRRWAFTCAAVLSSAEFLAI